MTPEEELDKLREALQDRLDCTTTKLIEDFINAVIQVAERNKP